MRVVHLTDPHLSSLAGESFWRLRGKRRLGYLSWLRKRRHQHLRPLLARLCEAVMADAPDAVAVTGDLVHIGLPCELSEAAAWLAGFGSVPVLLVPGNHDLYQRDASTAMYAAWGSYLHLARPRAEAFPSCVELDGVTLIGVCSARPEPFWSARGEVGAAQLARLDALLGASSGRLRCVLVHHPPMPGLCARRKALSDDRALSDLLARHAVELVLHGHLHHNRERTLGRDTRVLATASASNVAPHARASYRVLDIERTAGGWQVDARLRTVAELGNAFDETRACWRFARPAVWAVD